MGSFYWRNVLESENGKSKLMYVSRVGSALKDSVKNTCLIETLIIKVLRQQLSNPKLFKWICWLTIPNEAYISYTLYAAFTGNKIT